jgi:cytoskeletal protein CcmA (bactofilin family)
MKLPGFLTALRPEPKARRKPSADPGTEPALPGDESIIGRGCTWTGTIACTGMLRIEGTVKGEITVHGALVVAEGSMVEAVIHGKNIIVAGRLKGQIEASESVHLAATAEADCTMTTRQFSMDSGAQFDGEVTRLAE